MNSDKLVQELTQAIKNRGVGIRAGQAWFNRLAELDLELANTVRGGLSDPFYNDQRLPNAWNWLYGKLYRTQTHV